MTLENEVMTASTAPTESFDVIIIGGEAAITAARLGLNLVAGLNAVRRIRGQDAVHFGREGSECGGKTPSDSHYGGSGTQCTSQGSYQPLPIQVATPSLK